MEIKKNKLKKNRTLLFGFRGRHIYQRSRNNNAGRMFCIQLVVKTAASSIFRRFLFLWGESNVGGKEIQIRSRNVIRGHEP